MVKEVNTFEILNNVDVSKHIKKKGKLSYLSWAWAWNELKRHYPEAEATVYERPDGRIYWDDGRTAWVKVGVTILHLEHIEYLPIMDFRNESILISKINSTDVNNSIQRALTKAIARHGLGLYIYAGEDLPQGFDDNILTPLRGEIVKTMKNAEGDVKDELVLALKEYGCKNPDDLAKMNEESLRKTLDAFKDILGLYP